MQKNGFIEDASETSGYGKKNWEDYKSSATLCHTGRGALLNSTESMATTEYGMNPEMEGFQTSSSEYFKSR